MRAGARLAALALILGSLAAAPAIAGEIWDFFGSVGFNAGRAQNPRLLSGLRAVCDPSDTKHYDPNSPFCDPSSPSYDPITSSESRRGDVTGSLRLTGGVDGTWQNTAFDLRYSPTALFYYDRSYLNQVGHDLYSTWRHAYTPRATLNITENFHYTPEQDLDPNNLQQNNLFTRRTSRTNSSFRGTLGLQRSAMTTLTWSYSDVYRAFSSPDFIDSMNQSAGFEWRRRVGPRSFVSSGYEFGLFSFGRGVPGSDHHQVNAGYGFESPRGFNLNLGVGYNILVPDDSALRRSTGLYLNTSIGWNGARLAATGGYAQGFSDGGGVYTTAQTENTYANLRFTFTPKLSSDLTAARNVHERLSNGATTAATSSEVIRSFNGRSSINYEVARNVALNATYTLYRQGVPRITGAVPEVRSSRYSVGMTWSFR